MICKQRLAWILALLFFAPFGASVFGDWLEEEPEFLPVDEAFDLSAQIDAEGMLIARWAIAEGYYLYRHRFKFEAAEGDAPVLGDLQIAPGKEKVDEYFGAVEVYYDDAQARVAVEGEAESFEVGIGYQGCAEAGLCYPPQTRWYSVDTTARLVVPASR